MSETPVSGNPDLAEPLNNALIAFTGCIGEALDDICSYGLTIGETYVPFDPDEDDDCDEQIDENGMLCSQAWVRVTGITPILKQESFEGGDGCAASLQIGLEVGVLRCFEIPDGGEAPTATDVLACAMQAMIDMKAIHCAAMSCEGLDEFDSISTGQWTPSGPLGGQYGGIWTFDVELA